MRDIRILLREKINNHRIFYHGSRTLIPFEKFSSNMDGSGIVSSGTKYGGNFFTDNKENAEYYTEWFVCSVRIKHILNTDIKHPPTALKEAVKNNRIYLVDDVLDGAVHSDIVVVPHKLIDYVKIINWEFVGDVESYFSSLDNMFNHTGEEEYITQDDIESTFTMTGGGLDYVLKIPIFAKYFESK